MNFKILLVNGQDLSGSSHKEAVAAFEAASEPISVVLTRSVNGSYSPSAKKSMEVGTQTDIACCNACLCNYRNNSLSALLSFQTALQDQKRPIMPELVESYENDDYPVICREVVLTRASADEKLGITLREATDEFLNEVKVIVSVVSPTSVAGRQDLIREGDHILKINGTVVRSMFEAGSLLRQKNERITFLLARPKATSMLQGGRWSVDDAIGKDDGVIDEISENNSESTCCACAYPANCENGDVCFCERTGMEMVCERLEDAFSPSKEGISSFSCTDTNGKDSGVGRTDESIQNSEKGSPESTLLSQADKTMFDFCSVNYNNNACISASHEFRYHRYNQQSQEVSDTAEGESVIDFKASKNDESSSGASPNFSLNSLKISSKKSNIFGGSQSLQDAMKKLNITRDAPSNDAVDNMGSWARLSLLLEDVAGLEGAITEEKIDLMNDELITERWMQMNSNSASDNTSSAYNTGESLSSGASPISPENPKHSITKPTAIESSQFSDPLKAGGESSEIFFPRCSYGEAERCLSSDANSDADDDHCNDVLLSSNDCFEDAAHDFTLHFSSTNPGQAEMEVPMDGLKSSSSFEAKTNDKNFPISCVRRMSAPCGQLPEKNNSPSPEKNKNVSKSVETIASADIRKKHHKNRLRKMSSRHRSVDEKERSANKPVAANSGNGKCGNIQSRHQRRKKQLSESAKTDDSYSCTTETACDPNAEWKVRVRSDGTRYITKRPVRERILREREAKLNRERIGVTTDDDVMTELKLGKHWSKEERKKHLDRVREHKRRKCYMQRCRLDALQESGNEEDIVQLSHQKMLRRKNKKILDNFMTVQEILAHGNRSIGNKDQNHLLNVTYI